jgi:hypothetical protein
MTEFAVPIPKMPTWVSLSWTPTQAALIVDCSRCRTADVLYTTLLRRQPDELVQAVERHEACP